MKALMTVGVLVLLAAPSCSAQPSVTMTPARVVHRLMDSLTLVEHGDTVLMVRSPDADAPRSAVAADGKPVVMVTLFRGDSTYVLMGGKQTPMNPQIAKHLRAILLIAREETAGTRRKPKLRGGT